MDSLSLLHGIFPTQELNAVSCIVGGFFPSRAAREALEEGSPDWVGVDRVAEKSSGTTGLLNIARSSQPFVRLEDLILRETIEAETSECPLP